jgi:hypothetical protein
VVCPSRGYHGNSQSTIAQKKRKIQETLGAVPMRTIDSYFVRPQQHCDTTAPAVVSESHAMWLKGAKHNRMKACYKAIHEILDGSNSNFSRRNMVQ